MDYKKKIYTLATISLVVALIYIFYQLTGNINYILPRRIIKIVAIIVTGSAIAISTTIFMTITNNRILTPSVMGLDALYLLIQTVIIFLFGSKSLAMMSSHLNYLISIGLMVLFSLLLFRILFRGERQNIYILLLVGIILGTFFSSFTSFMQVLIDPNEFMVAQDRMFASINNVNSDLLIISIIIFVLVVIYLLRFYKYLDVLALGKEQAINLGVPYDHVVRHLLMIVVILVSVATALVGPIIFLGLIVVNLAYEFLNTYCHTFILLGSALYSIIVLLSRQFLVEKVFTFLTPFSLLINFFGCIYFIYLFIKEHRLLLKLRVFQIFMVINKFLKMPPYP